MDWNSRGRCHYSCIHLALWREKDQEKIHFSTLRSFHFYYKSGCFFRFHFYHQYSNKKLDRCTVWLAGISKHLGVFTCIKSSFKFCWVLLPDCYSPYKAKNRACL